MKRVIVILILLSAAAGMHAQPQISTSDRILNRDRQNGFFNSTDINSGIGLGETEASYSKYFVGLSNVTGYQFARMMKAGIGLGVSSFNGGILFPAYAHVRYSFNTNSIVPFLYADGGYLFSFQDFSNESRPFFDGGAGVRFLVRERFSVNLSGGLLQHFGGIDVKSTFVNLKAGIEFKAK
jgi:hypothetical protein